MDDRDRVIDRTIEREIEEALAVDPSPGFPAAVRAGIELDSVAWRWPATWVLAATGAGLAVVILAVTIARAPQNASVSLPDRAASAPAATSRSLPEPSAVPEGSRATRGQPVTGAVEAPRSTRVAVPRESPTVAATRAVVVRQPEVVVSRDEADALRRLFASAQDGRLEVPVADASASPPLEAPDEILIPPIVIEPLAIARLDEGAQK